MKVLVVGGGGREHALAWKAAQSDRVDTVFVAPGNAGTASEDKLENVAIAAEDIDGLLAFATDKRIDLTIVGPEAPLVSGIVDRFQESGLRCFGPTAGAAQLEGSKRFAKDFLKRHNIPTADYESFTDIDAACDYIRSRGAPIVIKADGLAAGKGVVVAQTEEEAVEAARQLISGGQIVVEEFLSGEEASFIVIADGDHILPMATSQDHKARDDGDQGPNTGGMGAYSPAPVVNDEIHRRVMREVIEPTVAGMASEGHRYTGFLYAGLMIDADGTPKVLEYNCRFGDPETQPIMMRLRSDLVTLCESALDGCLDEVEVQWDPRVSLGVVLAAGGYPGSYEKGAIIEGLGHDNQADRKIFHAGTAAENGAVVTAGGRVLCACALGNDVALARKQAYELASQIDWPGMFYRSDIGYRAINRD